MLEKLRKCKYCFQHYAFKGYALGDVGCGHCIKVANINKIKDCDFYEEESDENYTEYVDLFKMLDRLIRRYEYNKYYIDEIKLKIDKINRRKF